MNPVAIIQARMGSTRLPGKVLRPIMGKPMLWHIVNRLRYVQEIYTVVVATSDAPADHTIIQFCKDNNIACFAGSENDVLDRFYQAALIHKGDPLLRVTGDCPFVDPDLIIRLLQLYEKGQYDHINIATGAGAIFLDGGRFPDGLDTECFSFAALAKAWHEATNQIDREHVTPYIWRNPEIFRIGLLKADKDYSTLRWTVDNEVDFKLVSSVYNALYRDDRPFLMTDILRYFNEHPDLVKTNQHFIGKEQYEKTWNVSQASAISIAKRKTS